MRIGGVMLAVLGIEASGNAIWSVLSFVYLEQLMMLPLAPYPFVYLIHKLSCV